MRFLFGGIAILFLIAFVVGQIITPRRAPMRQVFARGFYYTSIGLLVLLIAGGLVGLVYYAVGDRGVSNHTGFSKMSAVEKRAYLDSLLQHPPRPGNDALKDVFVNYRFGYSALPCFESVHRFNVAALEEIKELNVTGQTLAGNIYEINATGEFITNQPEPNFHVRGDFTLQYRFSDEDREHPPGWYLRKIVGNSCEVLSQHPARQIIGHDSLYPDLKRKVE